MIVVWYLNGKCYAVAARTFHAHFGKHANPLSERQTQSYAENLRSTGSITLSRRGAECSATGYEHIKTVELEISQSSIIRILRACDYHHYNLKIVRDLKKEDMTHRKAPAASQRRS